MPGPNSPAFIPRDAHCEHEKAKAELEGPSPGGQQAIGHGIRAKRSKAGTIAFDSVSLQEMVDAAVR